MEAPFIIGLIFTGAGLLFLGVGLVLYGYYSRRRKAATAVTTATVADMIRRSNGVHNERSFAPVYEYYAEGAMHRACSTLNSSHRLLCVGDKVELHYVPGHPKKIYIEQERWIERFLLLLFCSLGVLMTVIGLICLVVL